MEGSAKRGIVQEIAGNRLESPIPYGEKNLERLSQRNGDRDRIWETRAGAVELRRPNSDRPGGQDRARIGPMGLSQTALRDLSGDDRPTLTGQECCPEGRLSTRGTARDLSHLSGSNPFK
jgi:hypothetical protein